jgi:O-methyltransferase involved in polyketide biosynthesis
MLVVTEGLLIYLTPEQVGELARDLHAMPSYQWWLIDLANPTLLKIMERSWGKAVQGGNAPFLFAPAQGTDFFRPFGWEEIEFRSTMEEARRLDREMRMMWLWRILGSFSSAEKKRDMRRMSGIVLLERI